MLSEHVEKITTLDGHNLSLHIFSPSPEIYSQSKCDGVILAVHGLAEYAQRYRQMAELTCQKNKIFVNFDLRGHGPSAEKRGDVQNFTSLILDIIQSFNTLKKLFPQIKKNSFAIFGHSFGGLLSTYAASILMDDLPHLFLSAPAYAHQLKIPAWKKMLANNMSHIFPGLLVPMKFDPAKLSNNPENNQKYQQDPYILTHLSVRFGKGLLEFMDENKIKQALAQITADVSVMLPMDDKITDNTAIKRILGYFASPPSVHEVRQAGHEAFHETHEIQQLAFSYYEKWLDTI